MESQATEKGVDREFVKLIKVNSVIRKLAFLMYSFLFILKIIKIGFNREQI